MKIWPGYEPSERLLQAARASGDPVRMQLLGIGDPYGQSLPRDPVLDVAAVAG
jgi:hypothetical protein